MLKKGAFISKRFNTLLLGCIWGNLAYCINMMTDSIISGNALGEVSLQAVSIVYPLFSVVYVFAFLISPGSGVLFGKLIGEFKEHEAHRVAGTALLASVIIGILLSCGLWMIKIPFLTYFGCTGELMEEASKYYNWLILFAGIQVVQMPFAYLTITDGESILVSIACVSDITANIVLSVVLSHRYGISGLGMASCIGLALRLSSYLFHFLKKSNNIKFVFCLDLGYLKKAVVLSLSNYMYYVFLAVVDIVLNKVIIMTCGMELIPAYAVVNLVFSTCEVYEAFNTASMGLITCFFGEKNEHDMMLIFRQVKKAVFIMGAVLWAVFFFGAPFMPKLFGLETASTVKASVLASRIMAFTSLGFGMCYLSNSFSGYVGKPLQACFISFLNDVSMPLLCSIALGSLWGFTGITIGMSLSTYAAFAVYALIMIPRKGKKGFPIYFEAPGEEGISYDFYVTPESIPEVRDWVYRSLNARGYAPKNIEILIEEFYTRVLEKNPDKRVLSECTMLFGADQVRVIIRDDGVLFNFIDENNPVESFDAHVLNSILEHMEEKNYVLTAAFNRNGFVFDKAAT